MSKIDIHPAVSRQEDAALLAYYRNRNLILAQLCSEQTTVIESLNASISDLTGRLESLASEIESGRPQDGLGGEKVPPAETEG